MEDESGLVKKENIYFIIDELVDNTVDYLVENDVQVDLFSGHYATGMAAAYRTFSLGTMPRAWQPPIDSRSGMGKL